MTDTVGLADDIGRAEVTKPGLTLLVWDAPNLDMALSGLLGRQPCSEERPRIDAIGRWLVNLAADCDEVQGAMFINVATGSAERLTGWVKALRSMGFAVFAKPKNGNSDVDADILEYIQACQLAHNLRRVVVASHDGRAFLAPLSELAGAGTEVIVLGFSEEANYAHGSDALRFFDLEDVPGAFRQALPRSRLDVLPTEGRWLAPLAPLASLRSADRQLALAGGVQ